MSTRDKDSSKSSSSSSVADVRPLAARVHAAGVFKAEIVAVMLIIAGVIVLLSWVLTW